MGLVDADKCPCILCEDTRNAHCTYEHRSCEKFCNWLNNTTYDVDSVVEQLEKRYEVAKRDLTIHLSKDVWANAIDIVRKGGV